MSPRTPRARKARVLLGPEPHLAHCTGCGGTIPKPVLPSPIDAFVVYLRYAEKLHVGCREDAK